MGQFFKDLFSESSDVSMTRFLSFVAVLSAVCIATVGVYRCDNLDGVSMLCSTFLMTGIGGKVIQRFAEVKETNNVEKDT